MKKQLCALVLLCSQLTWCNEQVVRPLQHRVLREFDGIIIDGETMEILVHVMKEIIKMQFGTKGTKNGSRTGIYTINRTLHTIHSLTALENQLNPTDTKTIAELKALLEGIKQEFTKLVALFIKQEYKSLTVQLIREWSEKRNRSNSLLLLWEQHETHELEVITTQTTTFHVLDTLCSDLLSFLDDLKKSCPIGWNQYLDLLTRRSSHS